MRILEGNVLLTKIDFALGKKEEAISHLSAMLTSVTDEVMLASLRYELWKMTEQEDHRQNALEGYQKLYTKTPRFDYKKRIEELNFKSI